MSDSLVEVQRRPVVEVACSLDSTSSAETTCLDWTVACAILLVPYLQIRCTFNSQSSATARSSKVSSARGHGVIRRMPFSVSAALLETIHPKEDITMTVGANQQRKRRRFASLQLKIFFKVKCSEPLHSGESALSMPTFGGKVKL